MQDGVFFFSTDNIELKEENGEFYTVGHISTYDKDLVNDVVTENCMKSMFEQMKSRPIKFDVEHESFKGRTDLEVEINKTTTPIAKVENFGMDANGLVVKAKLNKAHPRFSEVKGSIEGGFLDAHSIAYIPEKVRFEEAKDGSTIRKLDDIRLLNIAYTGNPINTKARISDIFAKSLEFMKDKPDPADSNSKIRGGIMPSEDKADAKPDEKVEVKAEAEVMLKSFEDRLSKIEAALEKISADKTTDTELKALRKEVEELKAVPQVKAVREDMKPELAKAMDKASEPKNPIDYIN